MDSFHCFNITVATSLFCEDQGFEIRIKTSEELRCFQAIENCCLMYELKISRFLFSHLPTRQI